MEKLIFDNGVKEFEVNGREILRFNPSDPNVYNRFMAVYEEIREIEAAYVAQVEAVPAQADENGFAAGEQILGLMRGFDSQVKERLAFVFGAENDFDRILGGVNLMAVAINGERVVTNLFDALLPVMETGIANHEQNKAAQAVQAAKGRRTARTK